jgi:hypothetical protein
LRSFNPVRVGELECTAWVAYYRHQWATLLRASFGLTRESFVPTEAARLEVDWWRAHRELQHSEDGQVDDRELVDAITALYSHVYSVPREKVQVAAEQRALAMVHSDRWIEEGRDPASSLIAAERSALIRSYVALRSAISR